MQTIVWLSIIPLQARMPVVADDDVVVHAMPSGLAISTIAFVIRASDRRMVSPAAARHR
jgi:hypothetical protein